MRGLNWAAMGVIAVVYLAFTYLVSVGRVL
jgi:hypothetical protein